MKARPDSVPAWPFAFAATAFLLLSLVLAPTSPRISAVWGEPAGQLQLRAILDAETGCVGVWLRNTSAKELLIHGWGMGYIESIEPELRVDDRWVRLPHSPNGKWGYTGIGPRAHDIVQLEPNGQLPSRNKVKPGQVTSVDPRLMRYWAESCERKIRGFKAIVQNSGYPLYVMDLGWFDWPTSITDHNSVTFRAKQRVALPESAHVRPRNPDGIPTYEPGEQRWEGPAPTYASKGYRWTNLYSAPPSRLRPESCWKP